MTSTGDLPGTRDRLISAAEELCLSQFVGSISLREVGRRAGAKNALAVQYWFGGKDGLIRAILERHGPGIDQRRHAMLDLLDAEPRGVDLRALALALVLPLAAKLAEGRSGAGYLRVVADLQHLPTPSVEPWGPGDPPSSMVRWREAVTPLMDPAAVALHRRFHTARHVAAELSQRAVATRRTRDDLFVSQLVDVTAAMLGAPISAQTAALLEQEER